MHSLLKLLPVALFLIPGPAHAVDRKHPTHRTTHGLPVQLRSGESTEPYHPPTSFETYGAGVSHPLSGRAAFNLQNAAVAYATSKLTASNGNAVVYTSGYSGDVVQNAYLVQTHDGVPFSNAVANVAFNKNNSVISFGSSFVTPNFITASVPTVTFAAASAAAAAQLNGTYNNSPVSVEYYVTPNGSAALVYTFEIQNIALGTWYRAFIDAHSAQFVSALSYVAHATYTAIPVSQQDPTGGFANIVDPEDYTASPLGWQNSGSGSNSTGNNAISWKGTSAGTTTQSSAPDVFAYEQNPALAPSAPQNVDAARVNAFYVANTLHDIFYQYGFTETTFNFQNSNQGRGGSQSDALSISVQDASGINDISFATPPDGTPAILRSFVWNYTTPNRDGALDNDLLIHEITHGLTNRLTGGGTARCLKTVEALALGEGWSDAMANWAAKNSSATPDFVIGKYVTNSTAGLRTYPYSTSLTTNPLLYSSLQTLTEPHGTGELWANALYQVYAGLVAAHGWSPTARTNPDGKEGNIVWMHLFVDALGLQPCSPTFLNGRDAVIQADVNRYAGANACTIWRAFASRGLGVNAANYVDDFTVPSGC
ncbi:hypothetical protein HYPSUDRAFT_143856 [Hypholoma sublateritium FD-334 SS-4]|uniref:Extracellular metalloproteinase n=1 Tax=Hypholoma sublateritium (strain FD-334 SS-4) TaxID=945553 RepID=A0A0D2M7V6_HYPSF|nr:hypothetical protein HYPSUDRAFT_143856 [Hypholoma sublateritium FD-334 SS-4]